MIIILSVALTFGSELIDLNYSFFTVYIVAFVFCFGLMEIGMLLVNNTIKKKGGKFFVFCFSFLALGYIFNTIVGFLFNDNNHKVVQVHLYLWSVIFIIGLFQTVYYWLIKPN